jgi:hypothetical protein
MIPLSTVLVLDKFKWLSPEFCSYIVNRKLSEVFCYEGGIAWAMRPEWYVDYMTSVSQTFTFYFPELIIIFLFVMLPIFVLGDLKSFYLTICLLVISIPLFMTTYDWGRWLFVIGHSVLLYTLATTNKIVSRKHTLMLFVFVPVNVMMQLPYCCSVSPIGGLLKYIDSLLKINLM